MVVCGDGMDSQLAKGNDSRKAQALFCSVYVWERLRDERSRRGKGCVFVGAATANAHNSDPSVWRLMLVAEAWRCAHCFVEQCAGDIVPLL